MRTAIIIIGALSLLYVKTKSSQPTVSSDISGMFPVIGKLPSPTVATEYWACDIPEGTEFI
jgi:hypothetical protein